MLLERVRALVPSMSPAHAAVAGVVLANPRGVVRMTVSDLAAVSRSSVGSVVRFCKDLGYRGFHDFKLQLATEASPAASAAKGGADEAVDSVVETVFRSTARAIEAAAATVDGDQFDQAAVALDRAERILVVSTGPSVPLAIDTVLRFRGAGLTIERSGDPVSQHVCASMLTDRDVCLAISHTGRTRQTVGAAQAARDNGAAVVVVTSFLRSPLTATASVALVAVSGDAISDGGHDEPLHPPRSARCALFGGHDDEHRANPAGCRADSTSGGNPPAVTSVPGTPRPAVRASGCAAARPRPTRWVRRVGGARARTGRHSDHWPWGTRRIRPGCR